MTTKKQKRERGLQKFQNFMADYRKSGLEALARDREQKDKKHRADWQQRHEDHSWKHLDPNCPHCQDMLSKSKREARIKKAKLEKAVQETIQGEATNAG